MEQHDNTVLVIGGGMAGMSAALEAAEAGLQVVLVEKEPVLGGRVAQMYHYFPKLCPPGCGLEINFRRIKQNPRIRVLTLAELHQLNGQPGRYEARLKLLPRYVTAGCTACGKCTAACPIEVPDQRNYGLSKRRAAYLPYPGAFPPLYVIDRAACPPGCRACVEACPYGAIDLDEQPREETLQVAAVIVATGWSPYDATKLEHLGYGKYPDVITNVVMERLAAPDGPTGGKILRLSNGKEPRSVVFVQCAGSRDENHLPYCSAVCCSASLKQARYVREQYPEAEVTIFYIDIRTPGRLEDFYQAVASDTRLRLVKGKVAKVEADGDGRLIATAEDTLSGKKIQAHADLVVLATGIVPNTAGLPVPLPQDEFRFFVNPPGEKGIVAAGCARRPEEVAATVQDGTAAALKALQCVTRSMHHV